MATKPPSNSLRSALTANASRGMPSMWNARRSHRVPLADSRVRQGAVAARQPRPRAAAQGIRRRLSREFDRIDEGSAVVPLRRVRETWQAEWTWVTSSTGGRAGRCSYRVGGSGRLLPDRLPSNVVPCLRPFGEPCAMTEVLFTRARGSSIEAAYTAKARARLAGGSARHTRTGSTRRRGTHGKPRPWCFESLSPKQASQVEGRFDATQEALVLEALRNHRSVRLRVTGTAEFLTRDRQIKRHCSHWTRWAWRLPRGVVRRIGNRPSGSS